jgi:hypothetical protein
MPYASVIHYNHLDMATNIILRKRSKLKNGPFMTYFKSNSSRAAGVGISNKLSADIQILDS